MRPAPSHLALYLAGAYTLLAIYASLHPFSGWRDSGAPLEAFLSAGWPRYYTAFDLLVNVAAYLPLGFLWASVARARLAAAAAVPLATAAGVSLSLTLETLQNYLPSRVPSNVDLACNSLGALIGALAAARWGATLLDGGRLHALRLRLFMHGKAGDAGLMLLGLWLLTQFDPTTLPFGNGDLRSLLDLPAALPYSASRFAEIEAAAVCAHTVAIGLLAGRVARAAPRRLAAGLIVSALGAKTLVLALTMAVGSGLAWASPGSLAGLAVGLAIWLAASVLPAPMRQALAALALLFATTLVNLAPENPYLINTQQGWNPGQFLNFHGLTRIVSSFWPFLALPWLMLLRTEKKR